MDFAQSFREFLSQEGIAFHCVGNSFHFDNSLTITLVPLDGLAINGSADGISLEQACARKVIHLYEDRWRGRQELVKARILAHLGRQRSIFARKCKVTKLSAEETASFLEANHIYGSARCKHRYGLRFADELVAVSTFSAPRPITRIVEGEERIVNSYEWVRFASLPQCRVVGGMGRLLKAFEDDVHPQDVMSYADREWSEGAVYERLGFHRTGDVPPVEFLVDTETWRRISTRKLSNDRSCRGLAVDGDRYVPVRNLGSIKYVKTMI